MNSNARNASRAGLQRASVPRSGIILLLIAVMCIVGTLSFTVNAAPPHPRQAARPRVISSRMHVHRPVHARSTPAPPPRLLLKTLNAPLYGGNPHLQEVALTFDDGPNPYYTPQVLAILQHYHVKATFFDVGYLVKDYPNLVRQEFEAGHIVANHSWSHPQMTKLSPAAIHAQLTLTSDTIQSVIGARPLFFRPPYGSFNAVVLAQASSLDLSTIIWNDEGRDWMLPGVVAIINRILSLAHNGSIILLHDGGGYRAQTVAALPYIITALRARGFSLVTIDQMVAHLNSSAALSAPITPEGDITQPVAMNSSLILCRREPAAL